MKWVAVIGLALLIILACVVYLHHGRLPAPSPTVSAVHRPPKPVKAFKHKATVPSPVDITGPLKDRALVQWVLPEYPEWAEIKGVSGMVQLKIRAGPDGLVKSFIQPIHLSGEPRLDEKADEALRQWQFEPMPNAVGEQWGIVTIRFSLLPKGESSGASVHGVALGQSASGAWECVREWVGDVEKHVVYICRLKTAHK